MDDTDKRCSDATEQTPPKIKAEDNPWYLLATLSEVYDHVEIPDIKPDVTRVTLHGGICPCCAKKFKAAPGRPETSVPQCWQAVAIISRLCAGLGCRGRCAPACALRSGFFAAETEAF
ncbi:MAG: hypothetical protein WBG11_06495, partial [Methylocella sp.]